MKKTLLLTITMFLAALSVSAQFTRSPKALDLKNLQPKATIAAGEGQYWWGPATPDMKMYLYGIAGQAETYDVAVLFNATQYNLTGKTVHAIRVYVPEMPAKAFGDSIIVWLSTSRPTDVLKANSFVKSVKTSELTPGEFNDIALDEPYTMTSRGIYAGYTFYIKDASSTDAQYPVPAVDPVTEGGGWVRTSSSYTSWYNYADFNLAIDLLLGGDFEDGRASVKSVEMAKAPIGSTTDVGLTIRNESPMGISSLTYAVTDSRGTMEEQTYTLERPVMHMGLWDITLPVAVGDNARKDELKVELLKVNGVDNGATESARTGSGSLVVFSKSGTKRVVEEEFTGTWCGWCTRGMVGMEVAEKTFGDKYIGVAIHKGSGSSADPMETSGNGYTETVTTALGITGFPSCLIDRATGAIDPYVGSSRTSFGIKDDIEACLNRKVEADIDVEATWATADKKSIKVTSTSTFYLDLDTAPYALGFILISDSLKGSGSQWAQQNYYSGYTAAAGDDENLIPLTQQRSIIAGMKFNHVAILGKGIGSGLTNSVKTPIVDGVPQTYNITLSLPTSTNLVQDKDNLRVVAFILDSTNKTILNARETRISPPVGIADVTSDSSNRVVGYYNMQGQRLQSPQSGVVIIRYADGHADKVLLR